jgi:4-hydroxy-3-polyprenylbenzoate decarboxylase
LQDFIAAIDGIGELVRIAHPVRAKLELCEIANRTSKLPGGGPALLFEQVILDNGQRSAFPVAINLFGSMARMSLALGVTDLDEHGARITDLLNLKVPDGFIA